MPKPIYGIAGSGMHTNMSLFKDGKNVFCDENGPYGLSKTRLLQRGRLTWAFFHLSSKKGE